VYTQCPECQIAFRVTVTVLQKAGGRVRCGGCGNAFSAIEHLSDGIPPTAANASASDKNEAESSVEDFETKSKALLETLDELAGPEEFRIEDTGVEWRVLDDSKPSAEIDDDATGTQSSLDLGNENAADEDQQQPVFERRYDDNTELPDDFDDEKDVPYKPDSRDTPQRRSTDIDQQQNDFDTHQVDLALQDDETWAALLDDEGEDAAEAEAEELVAADDSQETLARELEAAEAQQIADDSMLLPQLAADLAEGLQQKESDGDVEAEEPAADDAAECEDDDLSAEEEADIVQQLRDSTGSFQKQIAAAQQALDRGDPGQIDGEGNDAAEVAENDGAADEALQLEDHDSDAVDSEVDTEAGSDTDSETEAEVDENDIRAQLSATYSDLGKSDLLHAGDSNEEKEAEEEEQEEEEQQDQSDEDSSARDRLSQTMIEAGIDPATLDSDNIETIIMEGDFVGGSLDDIDNVTADSKSLAGLDEQQNLVDTYMLNKGKMRGGRRKGDPSGYGMMAGIAALLVLLAAQYLHASRETFATYGAFNQTVGPVYRALGNPVTPHWNIKGWQFEHTRGGTDENDQVLTVFSTVRNNSDDPLPYPLVHVSLTDRWEDIIGSKILEPSDYLAGDMDPRKPIAPGDSFTAVIAIERPSQEATGFQLYVCYRLSPDRVRCATEDFKH